MRIVIDMQGAQTESRYRGIGRYTMSFVQALVRNRGEHEIILSLSGFFPDTIEEIRAEFDGILPQENILVWNAPGPVIEELARNTSRRETAEVIREAFLSSLNPDIIHVTSLFEGFVDNAVTSIGVFDKTIPVSVSVYDLIPLLNEEQYLAPNPLYAEYYKRKISYLHNASIYLAISEFSRQEILENLPVREKQVVNVSTAIEAAFKPVLIDSESKKDLFQRYGVIGKFILYTGGADERKNLIRLIRAYAALPKDFRNQYQLVFAGKIPSSVSIELKLIAKKNSLTEAELIFTGYIPDEELVQFYNLCALFVFPSWHEGFGLPALEAMACGAPVIGSKTSSLPEVINLDEALFDPFDTEAITKKISQLLIDADMCEQFREHGLRQSKNFSWDEVAKRTYAAWDLMSLTDGKELPTWHEILQANSSNYKNLIQHLASILSTDSSVSDEDIRRIAVCIKENERQTDQYLRPTILPEQITWRIEGPFDSSYSLALVNRGFARGLNELGHRVVLHSTEGPGDFQPDGEFLKINADIAEMHDRVNEVSHITADVVSRNMYPPRVEDMKARSNFLHAYGWEESGFPLEWIESFNQRLQGMGVMSEHVRKIMVDHGYIKPIQVTGLGVDHWLRIVSEKEFDLNAKGFRFLHVSSCFPRKGADVMLRAYGRAFRSNDDVTLVIKTFPNPHNQIHQWLEEVKHADPDFPEVQIYEADYSDAKLKALYENCHALLAPSRAEGFGLPMAEAMLSGLAVITTGWGGQLDFCTAETAWLLDYSFEHAQTHFDLSSSVWAEPDETHLVGLMREVFEMSHGERMKRIETGKKLLYQSFFWSHAANRMVLAAKTWAKQQKDLAPKIGWVTSWNTPCGIASYSEHLISNFPSDVTVLASHNQLADSVDTLNVKRCWTLGDDDNLTNLSETIEENQLDTLVIQFNYGFFNFHRFADFLQSQIKAGRTVVVTLHSTTDPVHLVHKKLSILRETLIRCHRVLVHSPNDMNRLKQLGLVENVALFPHGVRDYVAQERIETDTNEFIIASYGFFLPHKGLLELIESVHLLRARGFNIKLNMVNAEYPVPESKELIEQAHNRIQQLGLSRVVNICHDYLSDEESLQRLSSADLIVFPYQTTGESSSAAVRYGLACRRPVAVTPLPIFDDVGAAVHKLPGQSIEKISEGISELIMDISGKSKQTTEKEKQAEQWRNQHRYTNLAQRLYNMLKALKAQENKGH